MCFFSRRRRHTRWMTFLPVAGMVVVLALSREKANAIRWTSALVTAVQLVLAVVIYLKFNRGMAGINTQEGFQFVEKASWSAENWVSGWWRGQPDRRKIGLLVRPDSYRLSDGDRRAKRSDGDPHRAHFLRGGL